MRALRIENAHFKTHGARFERRDGGPALLRLVVQRLVVVTGGLELACQAFDVRGRAVERDVDAAHLRPGFRRLAVEALDFAVLRLLETLRCRQFFGERGGFHRAAADVGHILRLADVDALHRLLQAHPFDGEMRTKLVAIGKDLLHRQRHLQLQALPRQPQGTVPEDRPERQSEQSRDDAADREIDALFDHVVPVRTAPSKASNVMRHHAMRQGSGQKAASHGRMRGTGRQKGFQVASGVNFR